MRREPLLRIGATLALGAMAGVWLYLSTAAPDDPAPAVPPATEYPAEGVLDTLQQDPLPPPADLDPERENRVLRSVRLKATEIPLRSGGVAAHPTWSWEGAYLAVLDVRAERTDLVVVNRSTRSTRTLFLEDISLGSVDVEGPAEWNEYNALLVSAKSAQGVPNTYIAWMGNFEASTLEVFGDALPAHRQVSVGQLGQLVYVDAQTQQLNAYDDRSRALRQVSSEVESESFASPTLNRAQTDVLGTLILAPGLEEAWQFGLEGSGERIPVDVEADATLSPVQARNGRILMYRRHGAYFDILTNTPSRVLAYNVVRQRNPMLDRSGTRLVWAPNVAQNDRILLRNLRSSVTVALVTDNIDVREPSIGSDGYRRWIAYTAEASSGVGRSLYIAPLPRRGNYRRKKGRPSP